ncbi:MAG TPA: hypothetical protein VFH73_24315, partial [Polyangia bacterium]|nr:hypothetical protein [Polyangia bacterium]
MALWSGAALSGIRPGREEPSRKSARRGQNHQDPGNQVFLKVSGAGRGDALKGHTKCRAPLLRTTEATMPESPFPTLTEQ